MKFRRARIPRIRLTRTIELNPSLTLMIPNHPGRACRWLAAILLAAAVPSQAAIEFHYESRFSEDHQAMLERWINEVASAQEALVGPLPVDVQIHFVRTDSRRGGPVPWANTIRGSAQGVRLHVNPAYSLDEFRRDWTAPHELSHLILPYLGRKQSWFAEGFASYMQYQVMHKMGVLTPGQVTERYLERLDRAARKYDHPDRPFAAAAPKLRAERKYPTMYWGGAVFFLDINQALEKEHGITLIDALARYLECCRRYSDDIDRLVADLDRLIGGAGCRQVLDRFRQQPGFPDYQHLSIGVAGLNQTAPASG